MCMLHFSIKMRITKLIIKTITKLITEKVREHGIAERNN